MVARSAIWGLAVLSMLLLAAMGPVSGEEWETKTEQEGPDETYFFVRGPIPLYEKGEEGWGLRSMSSIATTAVSVELLKKDSASTERVSVTFPYQKFGWSIGTWYLTSYGLRFYGVYYNGEQILYDYQLPWVKVNGTRYDLVKDMLADGPNLYVYNTAGVFKVWVKYHIQPADVYVETYVYFYDDGDLDPWAVVDCQGASKDVVVGQRFDFDLDGPGDDNAQFYTSTPSGNVWELVEVEDDHPDAGEPEDAHVQWRLFDTDVNGTGYDFDQMVNFIPYHTDDPTLTVLRYHSNEVGDDPTTYDNDEAVGLYSGPTYDCFIGYDLVAWYVSVYDDTTWCNPGPWIELQV